MGKNSFVITGVVKSLFDVMTFASGFSKREFLVSIDDEYPQDVKFTCFKERISSLDRVNVGDRVRITFSIRCREYKERYYTDLEAYRVDLMEADGSAVEYDDLEPPMDDDIMPF